MKKQQILEHSQFWLDVIGSRDLDDATRAQIAEQTIENFDAYYNKGFLDYRKSVTEAEGFAAVEWTGQGSHFQGIFGREYNRLSRRVRYLQRRHSASEDRGRGERPAWAHGAQQPGASGSVARRSGKAVRGAGAGRHPPTLSSSITGPTPSRAP